MSQSTISPRIAQMESHGVNRQRFAYASFCCGRGWRGHETIEAARKAAARDANSIRSSFGGGYPEHFVACTVTGKSL